MLLAIHVVFWNDLECVGAVHEFGDAAREYFEESLDASAAMDASGCGGVIQEVPEGVAACLRGFSWALKEASKELKRGGDASRM